MASSSFSVVDSEPDNSDDTQVANPVVVSLLDRLKSPMPSELSRKRKVLSNPERRDPLEVVDLELQMCLHLRE